LVSELTNVSNTQAFVVSTRQGIDASVFKAPNQLDFNAKYVKGSFISRLFNFTFTAIRKINSCDLVQFSSLFFPPTPAIVIWARIMGKRIIISPRGELYPSALSRKAYLKQLYIYLIKWLLPKSAILHATNEMEEKHIQEFFNDYLVFRIPNLIPIKELQIFEQQPHVLFIGRINPIKNLDLLIQAFAAIQSQFPEFTLIIAGEAQRSYEVSYLIELKQLVEKLKLMDKVKFLGSVTGTKKEELMARSYVTVLPSKSENFGNVVLESLAMGTPVIASNGTPWALLEEHQAGLWVSAELSSLKEALRNFLGMNSEQYKQTRVNSRKLIERKFDIKVNIHKWINVYENLIAYKNV